MAEAATRGRHRLRRGGGQQDQQRKLAPCQHVALPLMEPIDKALSSRRLWRPPEPSPSFQSLSCRHRSATHGQPWLLTLRASPYARPRRAFSPPRSSALHLSGRVRQKQARRRIHTPYTRAAPHGTLPPAALPVSIPQLYGQSSQAACGKNGQTTSGTVPGSPGAKPCATSIKLALVQSASCKVSRPRG